MILKSVFRNCEKGVRLFSSDEDALVFLEDYDLDEARATMLQSKGKALEAAEAHAKDGRVLEAVGVLLEPSTPTIEESKMAIRYVLAGLWKRLSFGVRFSRSDTITSSLLEISLRLDSSVMTKDEADEVRSIGSHVAIDASNPQANQLSMFKSIAVYNPETPAQPDATDIVDPDFTQLRRLGFSFQLRENSAAALICFDHVFSRRPTLHKTTLVETEALLSRYLTYVRLLVQFWRDECLSEGSNHQKVFGFEVQQEDHYLVPKNTFIYGKVSASRGVLGDLPAEHTCSREELSHAIRAAILDHIKSRVVVQEQACRETRGFSPCLSTLIRGNCFNEACPFQHTQPDAITVDWFHARLRFLFLEFKILHLAQLFDKKVMQYVSLGSPLPSLT